MNKIQHEFLLTLNALIEKYSLGDMCIVSNYTGSYRLVSLKNRIKEELNGSCDMSTVQRRWLNFLLQGKIIYVFNDSTVPEPSNWCDKDDSEIDKLNWKYKIQFNNKGKFCGKFDMLIRFNIERNGKNTT